MRRVKIDVAVRIRPTNEQAKALHYTNRNLTVRGTKHYAFSNVLTPECTQVEVFEQCKLGSVIDHMLEGYNSTVLAFGQTGAGKTYTMEGIDDKRSKSIDSPGGNEL
jgi:Tfp pilus assembly pilus retraction ATPase PilT